MNPVEFYLSEDRCLEELDLTSTELAPSNGHSTGDPSEINSLRFFSPVNIHRFSFYRLFEGRLQIVSPFGSISVPSGMLTDGSQATLTALFPDGLASWPVDLGHDWCDEDGRRASAGAMRAKKLGPGKFEPLHTTSHVRLSGVGLVEWAIVFLPEPYRSIKKNSQGGVNVTTISGLVFELPKGTAADLVLAEKTQWATPGDHGVFVLGPLPKKSF